MHPLIAASLSTQLAAGRRSPARSHRRAETRGTPVAEVGEVVIRRATAADAPALVRLGALDSNLSAGELLADAAREHDVLVAEVDGSLEAARALDGGIAVADPFRPSALHAKLLALRARQLGGPRGLRGMLHLRTS